MCRPRASLARLGRLVFLPAVLLCWQPLLADDEAEKSGEEQELIIRRLVLGAGGGQGGEAGYWIGISCHAADEGLRKELNLQEGQGVLVDQVLPESPAAKSGLKENDVITAVGADQVGDIADIAKLVTASNGHALRLEVVRDGKHETIEVTPEQRPTEGVLVIDEEEKEEGKEGNVEGRFIIRAEPSPAAPGQPVPPGAAPGGFAPQPGGPQPPRGGFGAFPGGPQPPPGAPGTVPPGAGPPRGFPGAPGVGGMPGFDGWAFGAPPGGAALPDDMQVTIKKRGGKPAKIVVKRGEQVWKTTEDKLDMLPPEARAYVARMAGPPHAPGFGGGLMGAAPRSFEIRLDEHGRPKANEVRVAPTPTPGEPGAPAAEPGKGGFRIELREPRGEGPARPGQPQGWRVMQRSPQGPLEHQLHELQERLEQLRRELERLRANPAPGEPAPGPERR